MHVLQLCSFGDIFSERQIIMRKMREGNEAPRGTLLINGSTVCVCNT